MIPSIRQRATTLLKTLLVAYIGNEGGA